LGPHIWLNKGEFAQQEVISIWLSQTQWWYRNEEAGIETRCSWQSCGRTTDGAELLDKIKVEEGEMREKRSRGRL
jgi:hypothetical protein